MRRIYIVTIVFFSFFQLESCSKKEEIGRNPYEGGKEPFGISFLAKKPEPSEGEPGEIVRFQVKGLKAYEDKFTFMINEVISEVIEVTDSTVDVRVPDHVSSGGVSIQLDDQVFFGPRFAIESKIRVDEDFGIVNGFNSVVTDILPAAGGYLITGSFTNFEDEASEENYINNIHFINSQGKSSKEYSFGKGAMGGISSIARATDGKYFIGGRMLEYSGREVSNIARLNSNGTLDTLEVEVINPTPEKTENGRDTVSALNGGVMFGNILKVFPTNDRGMIAVGSFDLYTRIDYRYSSRENRQRIITPVKGVMKLKENGTLDSTFNINNQGANGSITDAARLKDGRIVMVGSFTRYNGEVANRIVCIKPNGEVDQTFDIGEGANMPISSIRYNETLDKMVIAGPFKRYKGQPNEGVVVLDTKGKVDESFVVDDLSEGYVNFAQILNSGKVLITGSFEAYKGVKRSNILILERDGEALQDYNTLGTFVGQINVIVETTSSLGHPALLIGGSIYGIDDKQVGNIVKIELRN